MLLSRIGENRKQKDAHRFAAHRRICCAKDAALFLNPSSAPEALSETSGVSETDHPAFDQKHIYIISMMRLLQPAFLINREQGKNRNSCSSGNAFRPVFGVQTLGDAFGRRRFGNRGFVFRLQTAVLQGFFRNPSVRLLFAAVGVAAHDVDDPAIALNQDKADHALDELQRTAHDIERQNRKRRKPA